MDYFILQGVDVMAQATVQNTAEYWNNKWAKNTIVYQGRALRGRQDRISVDVKNFVIANDDILKTLITRYSLRKPTFNETAHACQQFVVKYLRYKDDTTQNQCPEFWQFPFETIASQIGDCEDGAILMASLMINAGIPAWRVKVCAGIVQEAPTAPEGGHAYCIYLADRPDLQEGMAWEIHDWCYFEDSKIPTGKKTLARYGGYKGCYKKVWFTFNNEYAWTEGPLEVQNRVAN